MSRARCTRPPSRGDVLHVGEGADRAAAERGTLADALGLVQPDRGLAERVVEASPTVPIDGISPSSISVSL